MEIYEQNQIPRDHIDNALICNLRLRFSKTHTHGIGIPD